MNPLIEMLLRQVWGAGPQVATDLPIAGNGPPGPDGRMVREFNARMNGTPLKQWPGDEIGNLPALRQPERPLFTMDPASTSGMLLTAIQKSAAPTQQNAQASNADAWLAELKSRQRLPDSQLLSPETQLAMQAMQGRGAAQQSLANRNMQTYAGIGQSQLPPELESRIKMALGGQTLPSQAPIEARQMSPIEIAVLKQRAKADNQLGTREDVAALTDSIRGKQNARLDEMFGEGKGGRVGDTSTLVRRPGTQSAVMGDDALRQYRAVLAGGGSEEEAMASARQFANQKAGELRQGREKLPPSPETVARKQALKERGERRNEFRQQLADPMGLRQALAGDNSEIGAAIRARAFGMDPEAAVGRLASSKNAEADREQRASAAAAQLKLAQDELAQKRSDQDAMKSLADFKASIEAISALPDTDPTKLALLQNVVRSRIGGGQPVVQLPPGAEKLDTPQKIAAAVQNGSLTEEQAKQQLAALSVSKPPDLTKPKGNQSVSDAYKRERERQAMRDAVKAELMKRSYASDPGAMPFTTW